MLPFNMLGVTVVVIGENMRKYGQTNIKNKFQKTPSIVLFGTYLVRVTGFEPAAS